MMRVRHKRNETKQKKKHSKVRSNAIWYLQHNRMHAEDIDKTY